MLRGGMRKEDDAIGRWQMGYTNGQTGTWWDQTLGRDVIENWFLKEDVWVQSYEGFCLNFTYVMKKIKKSVLEILYICLIRKLGLTK